VVHLTGREEKEKRLVVGREGKKVRASLPHRRGKEGRRKSTIGLKTIKEGERTFRKGEKTQSLETRWEKGTCQLL